MTLRWNHGGRKVFSPTSQRGAKITKSTLARPSVSVGLVSTVKIDGSGWSKLIVPITMKLAGVVLVRHVAAVPGDHVERRVVVVGGPEVAAELVHHLDGVVALLEGGVRAEEVPLVGQAVGADRAAFRQGEGGAEVLAQVAAGAVAVPRRAARRGT